MFDVQVEKIGDVAVILCEGRMISRDAAFRLRDEVERLRDAQVVLLDLSELGFLGGDGLDMLVFPLGVESTSRYSVQIVRPPAGGAAKPATVTFDC